MMDISRAEYLAVRLMLAYLHPDVDMVPAYVGAVRAEAGMPESAFDLANITAWQSAMFWWDTNPELGRKLLNAKLEELTGVPAA